MRRLRLLVALGWLWLVDRCSAWTYYANTGDVVQVHCTLVRSGVCTLIDARTGGSTPSDLTWVYSATPPESSTHQPTLYETDTARPPWLPDVPVENPKSIPNSGRYSMYPSTNSQGNPELILQITNATWSDAGTYACYCAEQYPPRLISLDQLVVFGRPYVIISAYEVGYHYAIPQTRVVSESNTSLATIKLAPDSNVTLTCVYSNTVFPIRLFVWLKDGDDFSVSATENTLEITGMNRELRGQYACRVVLSEVFNSTGPSFRLDTPEVQSPTTVITVYERRDEFPILLIVVLACIIFVVILMTLVVILVLKALNSQRREQVRFNLPNSYDSQTRIARD